MKKGACHPLGITAAVGPYGIVLWGNSKVLPPDASALGCATPSSAKTSQGSWRTGVGSSSRPHSGTGAEGFLPYLERLSLQM